MTEDNLENSEEETPPVSQVPVEIGEKSRTDKLKALIWPWGILCAAVIVAAILVLVFFLRPGTAQPTAAIPIPNGKTIVVPDPGDAGKPNSQFTLNKGNKNTPLYKDPIDISKYRTVDKQGNVFLSSPVDGRCTADANGGILPPSNYMHNCYYNEDGSVLYTTHAVLGPRTGAFENIQYLKPGDPVIVAGVKYEIANVYTFPKNKLPSFIFKKGVIGLVTCHIDASVKNINEFTKTDVAILKKVN